MGNSRGKAHSIRNALRSPTCSSLASDEIKRRDTVSVTKVWRLSMWASGYHSASMETVIALAYLFALGDSYQRFDLALPRNTTSKALQLGREKTLLEFLPFAEF